MIIKYRLEQIKYCLFLKSKSKITLQNRSIIDYMYQTVL